MANVLRRSLVAESDRCHWYILLVMPPSGSVTDAVSVDPPDSVPVNDAVPASSTFVTVTATVRVSLRAVVAGTFTVTL